MYWNQHCFFVQPGLQNVLSNEQEKLWGSKQPSFCLWTKLYLYKFFFTEILAIDKNLSEELGEKSVCRELISSPAPNLVSTLTQLLTFRQTMIKRPWKTTKWAKASHLNWKLWAIHDYVIMKEGKLEIECSRKVKCHEVGLSACTGGPLPGPSCVSWTLIWVFP